MRVEALFKWARGTFPLVALILIACEQEQKGGSSAEAATKTVSQSPARAEPESPPAAAPSKQEPDVANAPPPWADRRVEGSGFPCAVEAVLSTSCRRCHWDPQENDAPFPLKTWKDTQLERSGKPIFQLMKQMVEADLMPPLDALVTPKVEALSAEHKKAILDWLEAGAKKSDEACK